MPDTLPVASIDDIAVAARNAAENGSADVDLINMITGDYILLSHMSDPVMPFPPHKVLASLNLQLTPELVDEAISSDSIRNGPPIWTYALIRQPNTSPHALARVIDGLSLIYSTGQPLRDWEGLMPLTIPYNYLHRPALLALVNHPNLTDDLAHRMLSGIPGTAVPLLFAGELPDSYSQAVLSRGIEDVRARQENAEQNRRHYRQDLTDWLYPANLLLPSAHSYEPSTMRPDPHVLAARRARLIANEPALCIELALAILTTDHAPSDRAGLVHLLGDQEGPLWRHADSHARSSILIHAAT